MSSTHGQKPADNDFYLVTHVATTCDEHGVYVTRDSAEVIEIGWLLLESKTLDEVRSYAPEARISIANYRISYGRFIVRVFWSSR